ncbi:MAG: sigma-54 dependent transcriptional regulator [Spirochaetales bacterium]|jgi:DNA-binding NtrC family response regulator|nr:sigma-54 dependent transcriptional regulator [Spirochaetales bacterium]
MKFKILAVDDEKNIREGLVKALELDGYEAVGAAGGEEALGVIASSAIDLVITDLKMPGMNGEDLLKKLNSAYPTLPIIILTGHGTIETAVEAMRNGAYDFLTKPVNLSRLSILINRALENRRLVLSHQALQQEVERLTARNRYDKLIGASRAMKKVMEVVEQVAAAKVSVLITGESGVGKELVADALVNLSPRKDKPFIKVHCAALSESLLESELFGHEKGSFTGAVSSKKGRFELADSGTIFLDEIGEISPAVQVKILRVIQEKAFERVGGEKTLESDVRIISATNRNLLDEIAKGNFREDLYFRLNVVNIQVPPLRDRKEDIPYLISSFIKECSEDNHKPVDGLEPKVRAALHNYSWPGNIRELKNCIESAVVLCKGRIITLDDLPPQVAQAEDSRVIKIAAGTSLEEAEKKIILETLNGERGNKTRAAEILKIGRKTLHRKLAEYHWEEPAAAEDFSPDPVKSP